MNEREKRRAEQVCDVLAGAKERIEYGWTEGFEARDAEGNPVAEHDPSACAWCLFGAINASAIEKHGFAGGGHITEGAIDAVAEAIGNAVEIPESTDPDYRNIVRVTTFNDLEDEQAFLVNTQGTIIALLDRAMARTMGGRV